LIPLRIEPAVANLHEAELALDQPERVLDLRPDAGLDALDFIGHRVKEFALVQCRTFARAHGHMPVHGRLCIGALVRA